MMEKLQFGIAFCVLLCGCYCGNSQDKEGPLDLRCNTTTDQDHIYNSHLHAIQQELLLRLNLKGVPPNLHPNATNTTARKDNDYEALREAQVLENAEDHPCVDTDVRTRQLNVHFPTKVQTKDVFTYDMKFSLDLSNKREIAKAELRLYKLIKTESMTEKERVTIYAIPEYYGVTAQDVPSYGSGYVIFDVRSAIDFWRAKTPSLVGELHLEIQIKTAEKEGYPFPPKIQFSTDSATSQLVIAALIEKDVQDNHIDILENIPESHVARRSVPQSGETIECSLRPLVVDFAAVNWTHFVLFPPRLHINYCSGICTRVNTRTKHSRYLSRRAAFMNNPLGSPQPCCVPNTFATETLKLLPANETDTGYRRLEKLTVTSCVCR